MAGEMPFQLHSSLHWFSCLLLRQGSVEESTSDSQLSIYSESYHYLLSDDSSSGQVSLRELSRIVVKFLAGKFSVRMSPYSYPHPSIDDPFFGG